MNEHDDPENPAAGSQSPPFEMMRPNESLLESRLYFDLEDAAREVKQADDDWGKVVSTAKFAGKLLANVGVFGGKVGAKVIEHAPEITAQMAEQLLKKNPDMPDEQRARLEHMTEKRTWSDYRTHRDDEDQNNG